MSQVPTTMLEPTPVAPQVLAPGVRLLHIRHGQTDFNAEGRLQGQLDIPLNAVGREQAERNGRMLGEFLQGEDADGWDWIASPLGRTRETMEIVRRAAGLDPAAYRTDPVLRELTFGTWEGFTIDEMRVRDPALVALRKRDKWHFVPPEGESYEMLSERIGGFLAALTRPTIAVAHGGVLRVLQRRLLGMATDDAPSAGVPQDRLWLYEDGAARWI